MCNELRLTVDQAKRTWHFWHEGTWALKFYTAEVRTVCLSLASLGVEMDR